MFAKGLRECSSVARTPDDRGFLVPPPHSKPFAAPPRGPRPISGFPRSVPGSVSKQFRLTEGGTGIDPPAPPAAIRSKPSSDRPNAFIFNEMSPDTIRFEKMFLPFVSPVPTTRVMQNTRKIRRPTGEGLAPKHRRAAGLHPRCFGEPRSDQKPPAARAQHPSFFFRVKPREFPENVNKRQHPAPRHPNRLQPN
jgi:hypothetical protein